MTETTQRVLVALAGIPIAVGAVLAGGWWLAALLALLSALAAREFFRMSERKSSRPFSGGGALLAAGFVAAAAMDPAEGPGGAFVLLVSGGLLAFGTAAIWRRGVEGEPLLSTAATLTGAVYTGGLLSYGLFLRHLPGITGPWHGTALVFAPVLLTWASDTFAYFVGRQWGTRKLIPRVSPGKTVQGALGAVVGTTLVAVGYSRVLEQFPTYQMGIFTAAAFGVVISVAAQVGDLMESLLKRDTGVKDSGALLPGHGGALDRVDSLLFTLPLAYAFFRLLAAAHGG